MVGKIDLPFKRSDDHFKGDRKNRLCRFCINIVDALSKSLWSVGTVLRVRNFRPDLSGRKFFTTNV